MRAVNSGLNPVVSKSATKPASWMYIYASSPENLMFPFILIVAIEHACCYTALIPPSLILTKQLENVECFCFSHDNAGTIFYMDREHWLHKYSVGSLIHIGSRKKLGSIQGTVFQMHHYGSSLLFATWSIDSKQSRIYKLYRYDCGAGKVALLDTAYKSITSICQIANDVYLSDESGAISTID